MQADAGFLNHVQAGRFLTQARPGSPERRLSEWRLGRAGPAGRKTGVRPPGPLRNAGGECEGGGLCCIYW